MELPERFAGDRQVAPRPRLGRRLEMMVMRMMVIQPDRVLPEEGGEPLDVAVTVEPVPVEPQLAQPLQGGEGGGQVGEQVVLDAQHLREHYSKSNYSQL